METYNHELRDADGLSGTNTDGEHLRTAKRRFLDSDGGTSEVQLRIFLKADEGGIRTNVDVSGSQLATILEQLEAFSKSRRTPCLLF